MIARKASLAAPFFPRVPISAFAILVAAIVAPAGSAIQWHSSLENDNGEIGENGLGLLTRACARQYCHAGVQGLDLWLSLKEVGDGWPYTPHGD